MPKPAGVFRGWVAHVGAAGNDSYQLYPRQPRINVRDVATPQGTMTPLYESPDKWVWNFCRHGFERCLRFSLPLGATAPMAFQIDLAAQVSAARRWDDTGATP